MENILFIVCLLCVVVFFGYLSLVRYLQYRETIALAEKGLVRAPAAKPDANDGARTLRWGIAMSAVGIALTLGLWPLGFFNKEMYPLGIGPWMIVGFLPLFFGLGLVLIYVLMKKPAGDQPEKAELSDPDSKSK
jgi:hypothetical protein